MNLFCEPRLQHEAAGMFIHLLLFPPFKLFDARSLVFYCDVAFWAACIQMQRLLKTSFNWKAKTHKFHMFLNSSTFKSAPLELPKKLPTRLCANISRGRRQSVTIKDMVKSSLTKCHFDSQQLMCLMWKWLFRLVLCIAAKETLRVVRGARKVNANRQLESNGTQE